MKTCCVIGCSNNSVKSKHLKFYSFPGKPYEIEQRNKWITAVKRINPDGSTWTPSKHTSICSEHFVEGQKSNISNHPSYVPSIFPSIYRKKNSKTAMQRYDRAKKRLKGNDGTSCSTAVKQSMHMDPNEPSKKSLKTKSVTVQVAFNFDRSVFSFEVEKGSANEVGTQCNIGHFCPADKSSGDFTCHKFVDLKSEEELNELTGVSRNTYNLLLSFLPANVSYCLANKTVLLLFLMKMKLGLTFPSLAVMFNISKRTALQLFKKTLAILGHKIEDLVFWPGQLSVQQLCETHLGS